MNLQIQGKLHKFLQFAVLSYLFPFIYVQIRGYKEMILMLHVGKHIEEIISYKCVYFDDISCINEYTSSRKILNVSAAFSAVLFISVHLCGNMRL